MGKKQEQKKDRIRKTMCKIRRGIKEKQNNKLTRKRRRTKKGGSVLQDAARPFGTNDFKEQLVQQGLKVRQNEKKKKTYQKIFWKKNKRIRE